MNPYSATTNVKPEQLQGFQWRRALVFSVLILVAVTLVAFLGGLTMGHWQIYGATMEEAVTNSRVVRRIAYGVVSALLYWRLAAPLASRRWLHVLFAFACVQVLDIVVSIAVFDASASELAELDALARAAFAALVGWGLACLVSNNSIKPTPLRGAD
jgi:hypothetical protein